MKATNEILHEFMGECWHDIKGGLMRPARCIKPDCDFVLSIAVYQRAGGVVNPAYDSETSPRYLLTGVVAKVIERFGEHAFLAALLEQNSFSQTYVELINATADQRARACWKLIESEGK
jgi:hypothetical protein